MTNTTSSTSFSFCKARDIYEVVMPTLSPFLLAGIIGNALVLIIISKNKEMRNSTNLLLSNISASDLLYLLIQAPATVAYTFRTQLYENNHLGWYIQAIAVCVQDAMFITSMSTVALLASERYRALFYALDPGKRLTKREIKRAIALIWFVALAFMIPSIFRKNFSTLLNTIYLNIFALLFSLIPSIITIYCYTKIVIGICISKTICGQGETSEEGMQSKRKTIKMLLIVTVMVVASRFPTTAVLIANMFAKEGIYCTFEIIWTCTCVASCLTPLVYFTLSTNYKRGLKRLFHRRGRNVVPVE